MNSSNQWGAKCSHILKVIKEVTEDLLVWKFFLVRLNEICCRSELLKQTNKKQQDLLIHIWGSSSGDFIINDSMLRDKAMFFFFFSFFFCYCGEQIMGGKQAMSSRTNQFAVGMSQICNTFNKQTEEERQILLGWAGQTSRSYYGLFAVSRLALNVFALVDLRMNAGLIYVLCGNFACIQLSSLWLLIHILFFSGACRGKSQELVH